MPESMKTTAGRLQFALRFRSSLMRSLKLSVDVEGFNKSEFSPFYHPCDIVVSWVWAFSPFLISFPAIAPSVISRARNGFLQCHRVACSDLQNSASSAVLPPLSGHCNVALSPPSRQALFVAVA